MELDDFLKEYVKENKLEAVRDRVNELLKKDPCPDCLKCDVRKHCGKWDDSWYGGMFDCININCGAQGIGNTDYLFDCAMCYYKTLPMTLDIGKRRKFVVNCPKYRRK